MVAYVIALSIILGILASVAMADRVYCRPLIKRGVLVGVCFIVCNLPGPNADPCNMEGCIYDFHVKIASSNCLFTGIISLPPKWDGVIPPPVPGPYFRAETPPPTGGTANPIIIGQCKRFCVRVTPRCLSPGDCFRVRWVTTDRDHKRREYGGTQCCMPKPVGT